MYKIKGGLQPTPHDERNFQTGALFRLPKPEELPDNFKLDGDVITDQSKSYAGDDLCTAYVAVAISRLQEGVKLNEEWHFAASKELSGDPDSWGQNIQTTTKTSVVYGDVEDEIKVKNPRYLSSYPEELKRKAIVHKKQTYLEVSPTQGMDAFDTIRATIYHFREEKRAIATGVDFSWSLSDKFFKTIGKGTGHAMRIIGWTTIDGEQYLIYPNTYGKKAGDNGYHYVSRKVVNHFVKKYKAFMMVDMLREDIEYMLDHGIMSGDNWLVQLFKVIKTIIKSPFFNTEEKKTLLDMTQNIIDSMKPQNKLLTEAKAAIGQDISPLDVAPDYYGCAESLSNVVKKVLPDFPIFTYTPTLYEHLKKDPRFEQTLDITPGCIIITPSETGKALLTGHTGIVLEDNKIASNNSYTGLWEQNYTVDSWVARWRNKGGMPIYIFRLL